MKTINKRSKIFCQRKKRSSPHNEMLSELPTMLEFAGHMHSRAPGRGKAGIGTVGTMTAVSCSVRSSTWGISLRAVNSYAGAKKNNKLDSNMEISHPGLMSCKAMAVLHDPWSDYLILYLGWNQILIGHMVLDESVRTHTAGQEHIAEKITEQNCFTLHHVQWLLAQSLGISSKQVILLATSLHVHLEEVLKVGDLWLNPWKRAPIFFQPPVATPKQHLSSLHHVLGLVKCRKYETKVTLKAGMANWYYCGEGGNVSWELEKITPNFPQERAGLQAHIQAVGQAENRGAPGQSPSL